MTDTTLMTATPDSTASSDGATETTTEVAATEAQDQQASTEAPAKDEADTTADADAEAAKDDEPQGAPAEYADFTVPDGVELNTEVVDEFKAVGKELNLPQEQAQKLVDLGTKLAQSLAQQSAERTLAMQNDWLAATKADKEFGGDKLPANLATAKKVLDTFGSEELRAMLNETRLGDNPDVIRFFVKVGKAISEDTMVRTEDTGKPAPKTAAEVFYPNASKG